MNYVIANDNLRAEISSLGGEIMSVKGADGTEYMWQGDPTYWGKSAPMLFPFCGRLTDGQCILEGKVCKMDTHGFFRWTEMQLVENTGVTLTLRLSTDTATRSQYPREWTVDLHFELSDNSLKIAFSVKNNDIRTMYFGYGGHPGFNVPLKKGLRFEDYYLEFAEECEPLSVGMSDACFMQGDDTPLDLIDSRKLPLEHSLFDHDAIFLRNAARKITLRSDHDVHSVTLEFPQFSFVGIWHKPKSDAPFVCIEPWSSLPSRQGIVEVLEKKPDMLALTPDKVYQNFWSITYR
jgi:galactose mutarotase-like enzyme